MRRHGILAIAAAACLAMAAPLGAAEVNLNPDWGDDVYQAPSIFTPDLDAGASMKDEIMVTFHGFRSAAPNGAYKRVRKLLRDTHTTIGVNYNYVDVEGTKALLEELANGVLKGKRFSTFGTSLGAYWADWFGRTAGAEKIVMINPSVYPAQHLSKYVGQTLESERRAITFTVSAAQVGRYHGMTSPEVVDTPTLLILSKQDDVIDPTVAMATIAERRGVKTVVFETGGHSLNLKKHPARDEIKAFVTAD
ncbi:MAG: YqiA/YcfP family alpha/beta fold hydrolase [Pseudomonadota bacterium]